MSRRTTRRGALVVGPALVAGLLAAGCGSASPARDDVLADLTDQVIVPGYESLDAASTSLTDMAREFCETPSDENLAATRTALAGARRAWLTSEATWVGPVMDRRSWAAIDWPIAEDEIDALIADESVVLDVDLLSRRIGADQRGLRAVEYVLGPPDGAPPETLAEPRRCDYLIGVTQVIDNEAALLVPDWTTSWEGGDPYRAEFVDAANGGLDSLVNDALFLLEAMTDAELGNGMGLMGSDPDPDALVEGAAGLGVADLAGRTAGLRAVLVGGVGADGIAPLLSGDLVDRLGGAFDRAATALDTLEGPLRPLAADGDPGLIELRDALEEIQVLVSTEVVSALGVTIGFSDADGDSG